MYIIYKQMLTTKWQREHGMPLTRKHAVPNIRNKYRREGKYNTLIRLHGFRCMKCKRLTHFLTLDHIIPKAEGGTSDISNLQLLCLRCHKLKDETRSIHTHIFNQALHQ